MSKMIPRTKVTKCGECLFCYNDGFDTVCSHPEAGWVIDSMKYIDRMCPLEDWKEE